MSTITTCKPTVNTADDSASYLTVTDAGISATGSVTVCTHPVGQWGTQATDLAYYKADVMSPVRDGAVTLELTEVPANEHPPMCDPTATPPTLAKGRLVFVLDIDTSRKPVDLEVEFEDY